MMIKQINISNMRHLALQLNKAKSFGFHISFLIQMILKSIMICWKL